MQSVREVDRQAERERETGKGIEIHADRYTGGQREIQAGNIYLIIKKKQRLNLTKI